MRHIWVIALLSGCAVQPQDDGLLDIAEKTPEQAAYEREQDIESARHALEWQDYVCQQEKDLRAQLIKQTVDEQGWRIICPG